MSLLAAAAAYAGAVFAAGFLLGVLRGLWLAPHLGERRAELLELPFMLLASFAAASLLIPRLLPAASIPDRLLAGGLALALMLAAEIALVRPLRGMSLRAYLRARDPVAAAGYYACLLAFALMPLVV